MIQIKTVLGKVIFTIFIIVILFNFGGMFSPATNANSEDAVHALNGELLRENLILKSELIELKNNLTKMEVQINYNPTIVPIRTEDFINITSPYGWRYHPTMKKTLFHEGIDISAKIGTPVYSTAQGKVVDVTYSPFGYGNKIIIEHAYGFETLYAHLRTIKIREGQLIKKNQLIGTVGSTGLSTGPHLHYEIRTYGKTRDPLGYFYMNITDDLLVMK